MKKFSELGIKPTSKTFVGDKIKISRVLNRELKIIAYKLDDSKYPKNKSGKCLCLQIELDNEKHVIFTGSDVLIETIQLIPETEFPFLATIVREGERMEFR